MNEYNKTVGDPAVREGNWVEERSLREFTGNHRKFGPPFNDPAQTAKRNIYHSGCPKDWTTQTGAIHDKTVHEPDANGTIAVNTALPRVNHSKAEMYFDMAKQIVEDDEISEAKRIEDDINQKRFDGCKPLNRNRALAPVGRVAHTDSLYEPAITKYSADPAGADRMTPMRSTNPFGRTNAFTKPNIEFTEDQTR